MYLYTDFRLLINKKTIGHGLLVPIYNTYYNICVISFYMIMQMVKIISHRIQF